MAAHDLVVPAGAKHGPDDRCPADSVYSAGTVIAKVVGRRINPDGTVMTGAVNQEDYAQDRFIIDPAQQEELADALAKANGKRAIVPNAIATAWTTYAYMGMLDVRPVKNPAGLKTERSEIEFWAEPDAKNPGWIRIGGRTDVLVGDPDKGASRAKMGNSVKLEWTGFAKLENRRITNLLLTADGEESLRWGTTAPMGQSQPQVGNRPPEVAALLGGRPILWSGRVRYGIIGEPAKAEQISATAVSSASGAGAGGQAAIRDKMPRLMQLMQRGGGAARETIGPMMQEFQKLMREQKFDEASKHLDKLLSQLDAAAEAPAKEPGPR